MKRLTAALLFAALLLPLHGQNDGTYTPGNREEAVAGPLRSSYVKTAGRGMVDVRDLDGAFVKTATVSGSVAHPHDAASQQHLSHGHIH